jgi:hypothetical protein
MDPDGSSGQSNEQVYLCGRTEDPANDYESYIADSVTIFGTDMDCD